MRSNVRRSLSAVLTFVAVLGQTSKALAHLGVADGHTGGLGVPILMGAVAVVILMLYIAYSQVDEQMEEDEDA